MSKPTFIYGSNPVLHVLTYSPHRVIELHVQTGKDCNEIIKKARENSIPVNNTSAAKMTKMIDDSKHQGAVAKVRKKEMLSEHDLQEIVEKDEDSLYLILDGIQDPHNFGAIIRTAEASGVRAIIFPERDSVGVTPTVSKVSAGAVETIDLIQVVNLRRAMSILKEAGVFIYATALEAKMDFYEQKYTGKVALVLGSEGAGIRKHVLEDSDFLVKLPILGSVQSLNVSVTAGVCLYEVQRQKGFS